MDELREVLKSNADYAYNYILEHFKGVKLSKPEGTYMLYLDCEEWCKEHDTDMDTLLKAGVAAQNGAKNMERLLQSFRQQALK